MDFFFDLENPLTSFKEHQSDTVPSLFANECVHTIQHFPANFRRQAISLISKLSQNLDPFIPYLAVDYMDRFFSGQEFPKEEQPWIVGLLAFSCLSLAGKMRNSKFSLSSLQGDEGLIYDPQWINRMEVLILTSLKWRMRSITPFSFLYYFISFFELEDPSLSQAIKDRAAEIIFKSPYEIKLLGFKPSLIAASALLQASNDLVPLRFFSFQAAISSCQYVNKEDLEKCLGVMQDMLAGTVESTDVAVASGTKTPVSVLDRHCTSSESENSTSIKRRKLEVFFNEDNRLIRYFQLQNC